MLRLDHYEQVRDGQIKAPAWHSMFRCTIPEGRREPWTVERFRVELDLENMRMMRDGRGCIPGEYTRLRHDNRGVVMSDTTAEIDDCYEPYKMASGRCLIHGLGLGCLVKAVLSKPTVTAVDVVEIDRDVIALVGPHLSDPRLTIHRADCTTKEWPRGSRWSMVWHDIWDDVCDDNLDAMKALHRRFVRKCRWQGSWSRELIEC